MDKTSATHYQLIAVTLGIILLGGTILGSAPIAFADHSDELKNKIAKLKDLIEKFKKDKKCPDRKKYNGICDNKRPEVDTTFPEKRDVIQGPTVKITGTALDDLSGVKEILIKIDRGSFIPVDNFDGFNWDFTIDFEDGRHFAFVSAIDNVGNSKRDLVFFTVFS